MNFFFSFRVRFPQLDWIWQTPYGKGMKQNMKTQETNQLRFGIETYAFAREFIYKADDSERIKAEALYLFLDELHSAIRSDDYETKASKSITETKLGEKIRKRYLPYLSLIKEKYDFDFNFQDKSQDAGFENNKERLHSICKDYLTDFCYYFSDETLRIALNNWNPPADLLYFFVVVRYAIKFQFPIEFRYRKLMFSQVTHRRVLPKLITIKDNHLGLIGEDLMDGSIKSFLISRISGLDLDFRSAFFKRPAFDKKPAPFNYAEYIANNPSAKYQKVDKQYQITLSKNNLDLLRHSKFNSTPIKVVNENDDSANIVVTTHDEWGVFDMLFNYEKYAKLSGPPDALERFKNKLKILNAHYEETKPAAKTKGKK